MPYKVTVTVPVIRKYEKMSNGVETESRSKENHNKMYQLVHSNRQRSQLETKSAQVFLWREVKP